MTVITLCSGPVFAIAAAEPSAGSKARRGSRAGNSPAMRWGGKVTTVRNPLMTVRGTVESSNVRHENLRCGSTGPPACPHRSPASVVSRFAPVIHTSASFSVIQCCTLNRWPAGDSSWRSIMSAGMQNRDQWMSTATADARSNK